MLFSADPCVAVVPLMFAAAPLGLGRTLGIVLLYEAATLATMLALVLSARAGARLLRAPALERYGDAAAGGVIAAIGLTVVLLGI
jgi:threonine/homoserine/homoserine lactone efflux protein